MLLAIELGFRLGKLWQGRSSPERREDIGFLVSATLTMLALLLVFQVGIADERYDNRRLLVVDESNAVGTAYLRAGFLEEPYRTEIRGLLRRYVEVRLAAADTGDLVSADTRFEEIHAELWARAESLAKAHPESLMVALYIWSLNDVIDLGAKQAIAAVTRFSPGSWLAIYGLAFLTMILVGYRYGLAGERNLIAFLGLILVFTSVMLLIMDLDRPHQGLIRVNQQALIDLLAQMQRSQP
jgi:hypothetical protein